MARCAQGEMPGMRAVRKQGPCWIQSTGSWQREGLGAIARGFECSQVQADLANTIERAATKKKQKQTKKKHTLPINVQLRITANFHTRKHVLSSGMQNSCF
jgi:hypothetical protein